MAAEFDLNLLSFYRVKGQEWPQLPGLLAVAPPKRPARGREGDYLLIYLTLSGNTKFKSTDYNQITGQMAQRFYHTAGSLTAAMRTTADVLNRFLVDRNLRTTGKGQYVIGRLILGVMRGAQFIFAQCGPTHVFHLMAEETRQIHDAQISGRGLGFSQTTPLYLAQVDMHPADQLVLCAQIPPTWEAALLAERSTTTPDALRRKLFSLNNDDLNAVLIQAQAGKGNMTFRRSVKPALEVPVSTVQSSPGSAASARAARTTSALHKPTPSATARNVKPANRLARLISGMQADHPFKEIEPGVRSVTTHPTAESQPALVPEADMLAQSAQPGKSHRPARRPELVEEPVEGPAKDPSRFVGSHQTADLPEISHPTSPRHRKIFLLLARLLQSVRKVSQKISQGIQTLTPRLLPGQQEEASQPDSLAMFFISVAVPVLIVVVAGMVYMRYGRPNQYAEYYNQAYVAAKGAFGQSDPAVIRHAWESTIYYLELAESYQVTTDSQSLRQLAQMSLDNLDGILRLDFQSVISGGLDRSIQVSRMAATETDLYLLDKARGNILRAFLTNTGYEVDPTFKCAPGQYGDPSVGPLISLATLPKANIRSATLLAMDANGTLLYCAPGANPVAALLIAPELGWRGISGFTLDTDGQDLYVLDPAGNAVWVYAGEMGEFSNPPTMFFGEQVPQNMNAAIDLAVNGDELYLLFQDGHVTICTLSQLTVVPTRCVDPATLVDNRSGHQPGVTITDAVFTQMSFTAPPDPSLYMLEPHTQAVYRFSPRTDSLNLQGQFQATMDQRRLLVNIPAPAMAISPNRYLFMSLGNQVYYATDVP